MATRFDIRVDGESVLCRDDAAAVVYLLCKLASADEIDRVLLAAEITRSEMIQANAWKLSDGAREVGAAVRKGLFTPDDLPADPFDLDIPDLCPDCDSQLVTIGGETFCAECPIDFAPVPARNRHRMEPAHA